MNVLNFTEVYIFKPLRVKIVNFMLGIFYQQDLKKKAIDERIEASINLNKLAY